MGSEKVNGRRVELLMKAATVHDLFGSSPSLAGKQQS